MPVIIRLNNASSAALNLSTTVSEMSAQTPSLCALRRNQDGCGQQLNTSQIMLDYNTVYRRSHPEAGILWTTCS